MYDLLIACSKLEIKMVDKGPVKYFLSLEINRVGDKGELPISQKTQIKWLLKENNISMCRIIATLLDPKHRGRCDLENCKNVEKTQF